MEFKRSKRLEVLPPYLFAEIDRKKKAAIAAGRDIINLGIGDPDRPTPDFIIEELGRAASEAKNHRYALDLGLPELRLAFSQWFEKRFGVLLDPESEILPLIGAKEGIAHLPLSLINPGDVVLVPEPCYPPYVSGTIFAGGKPYWLPITSANEFLPDLENIPQEVARKARLLYLNYPNNPTAAVADLEFFRSAVDFAGRYEILIAQDAAYSEIYFDEPSPSILQVEGAKEVAVEFHSLSKTFNMTGWRLGFAVGNASAVKALSEIKTNIDSGVFQAIQYAGIAAYQGYSRPWRAELLATYRARRDALVDGLESLEWEVLRPRATFYVWIPTPDGFSSVDFASMLLDKADIVVTPGIGFGPSGEGFVRAALTVDEERIKEALRRLPEVVSALTSS